MGYSPLNYPTEYWKMCDSFNNAGIFLRKNMQLNTKKCVALQA